MSLRTKSTLSVATGAAPAFSAATASDTFEVGPKLFAVYRSTHTTTVTVTVVVPGNLDTGDAYPDKVYTVAIGSTTMQELWVPLEKYMQDPTTGVATITTSVQNAAITCALVER